MNKLLSLLISFALLFTQLAPLGYAKGGRQNNSSNSADQKLKNAGFEACQHGRTYAADASLYQTCLVTRTPLTGRNVVVWLVYMLT